MISGRLPTVPEYYSEHIDPGVDLIMYPKQCCPFHSENTPSFSFNVKTGRWSCFGKCHAHGDVIDMHQRYYHFGTREEAEKDLRIRYSVPRDGYGGLENKNDKVLISEEDIENNVTYTTAIALANCPERWLELDRVILKYPFDRNELQDLINKWTGVKSALD